MPLNKHRKMLFAQQKDKKADAACDVTTIPGVGKSIAQDLRAIGIYTVANLKGKDAQALYELCNKHAGMVQDKCLLYVLREAIYFAEGGRDSEKLKWWHWKDTQ